MSEGLGYSREHLRHLSEARLDDAGILFNGGRYSAAYYIGGYAIELGLKACIARQFRADTIPDPSLVRNVYTHRFSDLINLAGLAQSFQEEKKANPAFAGHWGLASQWTEAARYDNCDRYTAHEFLSSISDPIDGVHRWLKLFW